MRTQASTGVFELVGQCHRHKQPFKFFYLSQVLTSFLFCSLLVFEKAVIVKNPALEIATVPLFADWMMFTTQDSTMSKTAGISTIMQLTTTTITILQPFFRDHPGEPVPEENFWTLWCKRRLTEADTPTIRLGATPTGLTSAHLHHPPHFLQAGCPCCRPHNSVKALKATHYAT